MVSESRTMEKPEFDELKDTIQQLLPDWKVYLGKGDCSWFEFDGTPLFKEGSAKRDYYTVIGVKDGRYAAIILEGDIAPIARNKPSAEQIAVELRYALKGREVNYAYSSNSAT